MGRVADSRSQTRPRDARDVEQGRAAETEAERLGSEAFSRVMAIRRKQGLEGAAQTEQRDWWPEFCQEVLGYRPAPLAAEVYATPDEDAPWLKNA